MSDYFTITHQGSASRKERPFCIYNPFLFFIVPFPTRLTKAGPGVVYIWGVMSEAFVYRLQKFVADVDVGVK